MGFLCVVWQSRKTQVYVDLVQRNRAGSCIDRLHSQMCDVMVRKVEVFMNVC